MYKQCMGWIFAGVLLTLAAVQAQPGPTAGQVLKRVQGEFEKVRDYSADISTVVDVPGIKTPPMTAKIFFKKPDKVHIESSGFAMLPRDAVTYNPMAFNEDLFDAVLQGEETVNGVKCLKVKLLAKSDTVRLQRAMLCVDPARWLVLKMTTDPAQGGSADVIFTYAYIDNAYFLPSKISLQMINPTGFRESKGHGMKMDAPVAGDKRKASVSLVYSNHRVNKGIPDSIFKKDSKTK
ncbi:MAG: hypothetical protein IPP94_00380 [Ignavibacteria bacterium]|nr:hypothetical protein [Ignavibacteria bacterium]